MTILGADPMASFGAKRLSPTDATFLYGETPTTMMHIGGLLTFTPPEGQGPAILQQIMEEVRNNTETLVSPWNLKLSDPLNLTSPTQHWVKDHNVDLEYHVRHSALPSPGGERELGVLVSRLHSISLDFTRPPWELHLIEGLSDGRIAFYSKTHHSVVDGYTAMQSMIRTLSTSPDEIKGPMYTVPIPAAPDDFQPTPSPSDLLAVGKALVAQQFGNADQRKGLVGAAQAPATRLNVRIGRNRRFATQQYSVAQLKRLGRPSGATLNDVAVSIIGGGLRRYLEELGELPTQPLIAYLPVNIRPKGDPGGGNVVGAVLANLGTNIADPIERLEAVASSTRASKAQLQGMTQAGILAYSGALLAPQNQHALSAAAGIPNPLPLVYNLCVSNVPGPTRPLYVRGCRLEASFPVSIPTHANALNITMHSIGDTLNFGFVGDRDALPHLQKLAVYTGDALAALDAAVAAAAPAASTSTESAAAANSVVKKAPANKTAAKKTAAKKTAAKKTAAKKTAAKKTAAKKTAAKKTAAKKTAPARKSSRRT